MQLLFLTPPLQPLYINTQTSKPLPCSPITRQSHVLHLIVIVCLCELFPLRNICKLYMRSWRCEEQKCRLQIIWAVNTKPALKCAEWPVWKQQYLRTVYCWDAMMLSEMQQPEDWSKMGSQTLGQAQPVIFFICCLGCAFLKLELYYQLLKANFQKSICCIYEVFFNSFMGK